MSLLDFLNPLKPITDALVNAYAAHENAKNNADRIKADVDISALEAKRDVVIAASVNDRWWSPRNLMGMAVAIYVLKIIVWDSVLQWGVTPYPGEQVTFIVMTVIGFYFVSKSAETVASMIGGILARRSPDKN